MPGLAVLLGLFRGSSGGRETPGVAPRSGSASACTTAGGPRQDRRSERNACPVNTGRAEPAGTGPVRWYTPCSAPAPGRSGAVAVDQLDGSLDRLHGRLV